MAKVRLTIYGPDDPRNPVEVPDGEVEGLRAQGLLIEGDPAAKPAAAVRAAEAAANKADASAASKEN